MEGAIRNAILKNEEPTNDVLLAIRDVCVRLENVNTRFEMEQDNDLIDACIYEMEALRARYRYLLKLAKSQGLTAGYSLTAREGEKST